MRKTVLAATSFLFLGLAVPVHAETCPFLDTIDLRRQRHAVQIARPDGEEMCFTIPKSAGMAAGRITVLTVRPFLAASASEIEVHTTSERTRQRGSAPHHVADITAPELLGGGQIFLNADDATHTTIRVRPRHRKDYRLIVVAHEIDLPSTIAVAAFESLAAMTLAELMEQMFGTNKIAIPFLDDRIQHAILKSIFGAAKGHAPEQIAIDVGLGVIIKEALAGQDLSRPARIAIATFAIHIWRELSKGAMAPYEWTLPDHVRNTSQRQAAIR